MKKLLSNLDPWRTKQASPAGHLLEKSSLAGGVFVQGPSPAYLLSKPLNWLDFSASYPKNPKTFGDYIRKWRLEQGLFQKELAKMLGVAETTVVNWEKERTKPIVNKLRIIKEKLRIEL